MATQKAISRIIELRAAEIRQQAEKKTKSQLLRELADQLEADAKAAPEKFTFKAISGKQKLEVFAAKAHESAMKELDSNMKVRGWKKYPSPADKAGVRIYGSSNFKGYRIEFAAGKFSIFFMNSLQAKGISPMRNENDEWLCPDRFITKRS